jgi:pimeloyl-ACP methyl ester carboxylesterase
VIAVHTLLPDARSDRPPIVLVHGAANSALVWTFWQRALADRGYVSHAVDLRGHGASAPADLSLATMRDYADDVRAAIETLSAPPALLGWSMGGLVAMICAAGGGVSACVTLAPSTPAAAVDAARIIEAGEFDASYYGITSDDPDDQPAMPDLDREERLVALASLGKESRYARGERAAGIIVPPLACPLLVVCSEADRQWPPSRYADFALPAERMTLTDASHWGLVLSRRVLATLVPDVTAWIEDAG